MSIRDDLKAYLDGELDAARAEEVRAALESDEALREEAQFMEHLSEEFRRLRDVPEVLGLERTLAAMQPRTPFFARWSLAFGMATAAAAVLLAALFIPMLNRGVSAERESTQAASSPADERLTRRRQEADGVNISPGNGKAPAAALSQPFSSAGAGGRDYDPTLSYEEAAPEAKALSPEIALMDRRLIKTADLALRVKDAVGALDRARTIAAAMGGFTEISNKSGVEGQMPFATATLRVPAKNFESTLSQLRAIEPDAEVINDSTNSNDVTAQYVDTESKLKTLRSAEDRYRAIMGQTKKIGEVLQVQERLDEVRSEIESLEAQRRLLAKQSDMATINVSFQQRPKAGEPEPSRNWLEDAWNRALTMLGVVGRFLAQAGLYVFVFAPVWLPIMVLFWWLGRRASRR